VRLALGDLWVDGWIVDQQDDGLGVRFGAHDADRLHDEASSWMSGEPLLSLIGLKAPGEKLPVRVVHVTPHPAAKHECLVGLIYDRRRMRPEHVLQLLENWQRFEPTTSARRP
jgi:hypothetical protein